MGSPIQHEKIRRTLAKNLKHFLAEAQISENALAQKIKLSQKQINNITNARTGCGIDALSEIAAALGLEPWMLIVDDGDKITRPNRATRVLACYLEADDETRDLIEQFTKRIVIEKRS